MLNPFVLNRVFKPTRLSQAVMGLSLLAPPAISVAAVIEFSAQPLDQAITQLAEQTGVHIGGDSALLQGKQAPTIRGDYSVEQALQILLNGSGVSYRFVNSTTVVLQPEGGAVMMLDPVRIQGSEEARFGDTPKEPGGFKAEYQKTATKMAMPLKETPQAISVISSKIIEARQVNDIYSALETTAGIGSNFFGHAGPFSGVSIRGGSNAFSIRGETLNPDRDIRSDGFSVGGLSNYDMSIYERVEVVKGPSGFYGQGSLGGFINMVRKKPDNEFAASVSVQAASFNTYRGDFDIKGALNNEENITGRLITAHSDSNSFVDGVETTMSLVAPSLAVDIGKNTRALLQLFYQQEDFVPNPGVPLSLNGDRYEALNISRSTYVGVPSEEKSDVETASATLKIDHELNDQWLATLLLQTESSSRHDILENYGYGVGNSGNVYLYANLIDTERDFWAGELRMEGRFDLFGLEHKVISGVEINERKSKLSEGYYYLGAGNIYSGDFIDAGTLSSDNIAIDSIENRTDNNSAVYVQGLFSFSDRTKLLAGARYDRAKQELDAVLDNNNKKQVNTEWTFRLGLTHELNDNVNVYASYGQSFTPVRRKTRNDELLTPVTGDGYELGIKSNWLSGKLGANVAVFRQEAENQPVLDPECPLNPECNGRRFHYIAAGQQRTDGIEMEIIGSPIEGLSLSAAATYMDAEYIDPIDINNGLSPWSSVKKKLSFYANYEIQQGSFSGLGIGATYVNMGETEILLRGEQQYVDGYERTDLHISYNELKNWDFTLQVRNIFDKTYLEKVRGGGFFNYYGSPRATLLKVKYSF